MVSTFGLDKGVEVEKEFRSCEFMIVGPENGAVIDVVGLRG